MPRWSEAQLNQHLHKRGEKPSTVTANALTVQIIEHMNKNGYHVWRNNTIGVFDPTQAVKKLLAYTTTLLRGKAKPSKKELYSIIKSCYRKHHGQRGVSDIIGIRKSDGKFVAVEVKVGDDILSPFQINFKNEINEANGIAVIARNFNEFTNNPMIFE